MLRWRSLLCKIGDPFLILLKVIFAIPYRWCWGSQYYLRSFTDGVEDPNIIYDPLQMVLRIPILFMIPYRWCWGSQYYLRSLTDGVEDPNIICDPLQMVLRIPILFTIPYRWCWGSQYYLSHGKLDTLDTFRYFRIHFQFLSIKFRVFKTFVHLFLVELHARY